MSTRSLIQSGVLEPESETVEYKESWHENYLKDLAALANTRGGTLRIGIRDDGSVVGWSGSGRDEEAIANRITDTLGIHPRRLEIDDFAGVGVLAITMSEAAIPVAVRGRYYRRVGNSTREVTDAERVRFLLEKTGQSWDELPCDAGLSDLAENTIADFRILARERLPQMSSSDSNEGMLDKLTLRSPDGALKRGAYLLFGTNPNSRFRNAEVQVGRFADGTTILDDQLVRGNLFDQFNHTIQAVRKHLLVRYEIPNFSTEGRVGAEDLQRREIWEIPLVAIREAILNALIHRDYTVNDSILIRIFDDRMTISNSGGLLEGMTVSDLLETSHKSLRRNPILAEMIYYTKYIERWGTGTNRMRDACRADGVPEPEFEASPNGFTVTFRRVVRPNRQTEVSLTKNEVGVLEIARREGRVTAKMCIEELGLSRWHASRLLTRLVEIGILISSGEGRSRSYLPI